MDPKAWDAVGSDDGESQPDDLPNEAAPVARQANLAVQHLVPHAATCPTIVCRRGVLCAVQRRHIDYVRLRLPEGSTDIVQRVAVAAGKNAPPRKTYMALFEQFTSAVTSTSVPGRAVMAKITGHESHTHIAEKLVLMASAMHFGTRYFLHAVIASLYGAIKRKDMRPQHAWTFFASDSTTLPVGTLAWSSKSRGPEHATGCVSSFRPDEAEDNVTEASAQAKIHQSSLAYAFLMHPSRGPSLLLVVPVVLPLQVTDCGVAEVAYTAWEESMSCEHLRDLCSEAETSSTFMSMDRDAANVRGHREWEARHPEDEHQRSRCYAHCLWTVVGDIFMIVPGLLSGIVSVNMSTRSGAHWKLVRQTAEDVIYYSLQHVDADLPVCFGVFERAYRDAVFDKCISDTVVGKLRKDKLKELLPCSLRSEWIPFYKRGVVTDEDKRAHARELRDELLPKRIASLRRQRWLTSLGPLKELSLLGNTCNLLDRILKHFYIRARKKPDVDMVPSREVVFWTAGGCIHPRNNCC